MKSPIRARLPFAAILAAALLALFQEREQTDRMAKLARERMLERHQATRLVGDIDWLYRELLAVADQPRPAVLSSTGGGADG